MKQGLRWVGIAVCLLLPMAALAADLVPTPTWLGVYGKVTYLGAPVEKGDEVRAYTPEGFLVGKFVIEKASTDEYGFMPIYGDDPYTPAKDGAATGDVIKFVLFRVSDGKEHAVTYQSVPGLLWAASGEETRLDLMY